MSKGQLSIQFFLLLVAHGRSGRPYHCDMGWDEQRQRDLRTRSPNPKFVSYLIQYSM
jgi:hypothetical protein